LVKKDRLRQGRNASSSFGIIDSQSVKTTGSAECRATAGKKIKGRKRHIIVERDVARQGPCRNNDTIAGGSLRKRFSTDFAGSGDDGVERLWIS
jgi:hypothetical protein